MMHCCGYSIDNSSQPGTYAINCDAKVTMGVGANLMINVYWCFYKALDNLTPSLATNIRA